MSTDNPLAPQPPATKTRVFYAVLANTLFVSVINFTVWFAITFYAYIQTRSVFVTGMVGGIYLVATLLTGIWFGSLVDHHKKRTVMAGSSLASLLLYAASLAVYLIVPESVFQNPYHPLLWLFVILLLCGVIAGNIRTIVLPTLVTILIPATRRDKANGLVGTATGASFLVTSVISGVLVARGGMLYVLLLALAITAAALIHLFTITIPERGIAHVEGAPAKIDLKGTYKVVLTIPGLMALILFATFNNFLGGVFLALMDAYGLSLMSVEAWGILWGVLSAGLVVGGLIVAKKGLGKNPVRSVLLGNVLMWIICILFPLHSSIWPLAVGMLLYMALIPFVEASEQTVMQRVVPIERQGRVFGFAQSVEQAASPLTAFLIGPLTQFLVIPWMTTGWGARHLGGWFGTGDARGIAVVFVITGCIGLAVTLLALRSKYYRRLSQRYLSSPAVTTEEATAA